MLCDEILRQPPHCDERVLEGLVHVNIGNMPAVGQKLRNLLADRSSAAAVDVSYNSDFGRSN